MVKRKFLLSETAKSTSKNLRNITMSIFCIFGILVCIWFGYNAYVEGKYSPIPKLLFLIGLGIYALSYFGFFDFIKNLLKG